MMCITCKFLKKYIYSDTVSIILVRRIQYNIMAQNIYYYILLEKICHAIKTRNYSCTYSMEVIKAKKMIKISSIIKFYLLFSFQR